MGVGRRPERAIVEAYQGGVGIIELADRFGCSQTGIRSVLRRAGVRMRPRGGVVRQVDSDGIVRLRDVERLGWLDIAALTGMTDNGMRMRYRVATGGRPNLEWHRRQAQRPDLTSDQLRELNSVIDQRDEIVEAYLSGQASANQLSREYGISDITVRRWAERVRSVSTTVRVEEGKGAGPGVRLGGSQPCQSSMQGGRTCCLSLP